MHSTVYLNLIGKVPSHKNRWKVGKRGVYTDRTVMAQMGGLVLQAKSQWSQEPVIHPDITIRFHIKTARQDRDNMAQTVLDILRHAGVLVNDNIAKCNGKLTILPAMIDTEESVFIEISGGEFEKSPKAVRRRAKQ